MADCCKIIRLLKEVKRKADTSFCEINQKIARLESRYDLLCKQNDELKRNVEESKRKLEEINHPPLNFVPQQPEAAGPVRRNPRRGPPRGSRKPSRSALKKRKRLLPKKGTKKMARKSSGRRSKKGNAKRKNPCL